MRGTKTMEPAANYWEVTAMGHAVTSEHCVESAPTSRRVCNAQVLAKALVQFAGAGIAGYVLELPVWVALAGWVVFYSRGSTPRDGAYNLACAITGLGLGIASLSAAAGFALDPAWAALPVALLLAASGVQLMQFMTGVNNIPGYYIGVLIAAVAHMDTSLDSYLTLTAAVSVGVFVGAAGQVTPGLAKKAAAIKPFSLR